MTSDTDEATVATCSSDDMVVVWEWSTVAPDSIEA